LRYPSHAISNKGDPGEAIGEKQQPFRAQSAQGNLIKAVIRRHKQPGIQPSAAQQRKAIAESIALLNERIAGEFRPAVER
jgi:hypothetical protein